MFYALMCALIGLLFVFWAAAAWGLHLAAQRLATLAPAKLEAASTAAGDAARQAVPLLGLPDWLTAGVIVRPGRQVEPERRGRRPL